MMKYRHIQDTWNSQSISTGEHQIFRFQRISMHCVGRKVCGITERSLALWHAFVFFFPFPPSLPHSNATDASPLHLNQVKKYYHKYRRTTHRYLSLITKGEVVDNTHKTYKITDEYITDSPDITISPIDEQPSMMGDQRPEDTAIVVEDINGDVTLSTLLTHGDTNNDIESRAGLLDDLLSILLH